MMIFSEERYPCLFVGGLTSVTTADELRAYFEQFGEVHRVKIERNKGKNTRCKGFAYIKMKEKLCADQLLEYEHRFQGRTLDIEIAAPKGMKEKYRHENQQKKVHINFIPTNTSDDTLKKYFEQFGEVKKAYQIREFKTNRSLGYGYVDFKNEFAALTVIKFKSHYINDKDKITCSPFFSKSSKGYQFNKVSNLEFGRDYTSTDPIFRSEQPDSNPLSVRPLPDPKPDSFLLKKILDPIQESKPSYIKNSQDKQVKKSLLGIPSLNKNLNVVLERKKSKLVMRKETFDMDKHSKDKFFKKRIDQSPDNYRYNILRRRVSEIPGIQATRRGASDDMPHLIPITRNIGDETSQREYSPKVKVIKTQANVNK